MAQIPDLDPIGSPLTGLEQIAARGDSVEDVRVTMDELATFVKGELTPSEVLAQVIAANPQINGLDANLLQGFAASSFRNASLLSSGSIPSARLPQGEFDYSWSAGSGISGTEGSLRCFWKIPLFVSNGSPSGIMLQFGWTPFVVANTALNVTFLRTFSSFLGDANMPLILLTPECRSLAATYPEEYTELDVRLDTIAKTRSSFRCHTRRSSGRGDDYVRANWLAVGFYS